MDRVAETEVRLTLERAREMEFARLVKAIVDTAGTDEATAKAAILPLAGEGIVEITPEWQVQLRPKVTEATQAA